MKNQKQMGCFITNLYTECKTSEDRQGEDKCMQGKWIYNE